MQARPPRQSRRLRQSRMGSLTSGYSQLGPSVVREPSTSGGGPERLDRTSDISLPLPRREGKKGRGIRSVGVTPHLTRLRRASPPPVQGGRICCAHAETPPWRGLLDATRSAAGASLSPHSLPPCDRGRVVFVTMKCLLRGGFLTAPALRLECRA
jgi:hypothetical protein